MGEKTTGSKTDFGLANAMSSSLASLVFLFFICVFLLTAGGHFYYQDGYYKFLLTDNIFKGLGLEHDQFYTLGAGGRNVSSFPVGQSIWITPLYLAGHLFFHFLRFSDPVFTLDNPLYFTSLFVTFVNVFFAAGVCALFFKAGRRLGYSVKTSWIATMLLGFGTTLWPYSKFCFSEPQAAFFLMGSFYFLLALRESPTLRNVLVSGVLFGLGLVTKYELLMLFPAFLAYGVYKMKKEGIAKALTAGAIFAAVAGLLGGTIFVWNYVRFGHFFSFGAYDYFVGKLGKIFPVSLLLLSTAAYATWHTVKTRGLAPVFRWILSAVIGIFITAVFFHVVSDRRVGLYFYRVLLSSGKSIFVYSPVLILSAAYFKKFYFSSRAEALFVAACFGIYVSFLTSDTIWGWGSRYYVSILPFLILPLFEFVKHFPKFFAWRGIALGIVLVSLSVQVLSVAVNYQDSLNVISRWAARSANIQIRNFDEERRFVFSRLLYDPQFTPLAAQYLVLKAVVTDKRPRFNPALLVKPGVRDSKEWRIDIWWLYILERGIPAGLVYSMVAFLLLSVVFLFGLIYRRW